MFFSHDPFPRSPSPNPVSTSSGSSALTLSESIALRCHRLSQGFECPICRYPVRECRVLPCTHWACHICLNRVIEQAAQEDAELQQMQHTRQHSHTKRKVGEISCVVCRAPFTKRSVYEYPMFDHLVKWYSCMKHEWQQWQKVDLSQPTHFTSTSTSLMELDGDQFDNVDADADANVRSPGLKNRSDKRNSWQDSTSSTAKRTSPPLLSPASPSSAHFSQSSIQSLLEPSRMDVSYIVQKGMEMNAVMREPLQHNKGEIVDHVPSSVFSKDVKHTIGTSSPPSSPVLLNSHSLASVTDPSSERGRRLSFSVYPPMHETPTTPFSTFPLKSDLVASASMVTTPNPAAISFSTPQQAPLTKTASFLETSSANFEQPTFGSRAQRKRDQDEKSTSTDVHEFEVTTPHLVAQHNNRPRSMYSLFTSTFDHHFTTPSPVSSAASPSDNCRHRKYRRSLSPASTASTDTMNLSASSAVSDRLSSPSFASPCLPVSPAPGLFHIPECAFPKRLHENEEADIGISNIVPVASQLYASQSKQLLTETPKIKRYKYPRQQASSSNSNSPSVQLTVSTRSAAKQAKMLHCRWLRTKLDPQQMTTVNELVELIDRKGKEKVELVSEFDEEVTHLLTSATSQHPVVQARTIKYFRCILANVPIVTIDYVTECMMASSVLPIHSYCITGDTIDPHGVTRARQICSQNPNTRLFSSCKFLALPGSIFSNANTAREVPQLIQTGHGHWYSEETDFDKDSVEHGFILYDDLREGTVQYNRALLPMQKETGGHERSRVITLTFLFNCISRYVLPYAPDPQYNCLYNSSNSTQNTQSVPLIG